ncbi:glycosyltransferase involved in cell wall biosynthesis [Christiangramia gaetbulicola]|uniref:Glycosyltransferase involved in cell wall biosynthesis n=1 Tax=Christiangramia gaetbulicola TaxID=703340 RepID=A0A2T6AJS3_9FLAO|nr:glycosyltransferase family 4 protein [Christiangramia gaetbulicola]PTX44054.1 glycosyltransferase involved in cell wall biosynthesis [Christiangramia gaetbulicola]
MKKRILYIGNDLQVNSFTVTYISFFSKMLRKEGYKVKTASTRNNKALRLAEMIGLIARFKDSTDVVLIDTYGAMNFYYAYLVGKTCKLFDLEYIPILHGGNLPERLENSRKLSKSLFGNAKVNIAPSHFLHDIFQKHGFNNTEIIPNAIKSDNYPFKKRSSFRPKLLWVRRFQKRYNPFMALKVLRILKQSYPDASLCMVGPEKDGTMASCKKLAEKYDLEVRFTGKLRKKHWAELSRNYDFFINTTSVDNTPISVIEAMSLGLAIVSTDVGGMPMLIENGHDGILVPEDDEKIMANEIIKIIEDPEKGEKICLNARDKVDQFDWDLVKEQWNRVLN